MGVAESERVEQFSATIKVMKALRAIGRAVTFRFFDWDNPVLSRREQIICYALAAASFLVIFSIWFWG